MLHVILYETEHSGVIWKISVIRKKETHEDGKKRKPQKVMESNGIGHLFIFSKRIHDRGKRDIERRKCSQAERVTPAHIYLLLAGVCFKTEKPKIRNGWIIK